MKKIYIPFFIIIIYVLATAVNVSGGHIKDMSFTDFLIVMFAGNKYSQTTKDMTDIIFSVPMIYLFINIYVSVLVGYVYQEELDVYGTNYLLKRKSRANWWRTIWFKCLLVIFKLYMVCILTLFILSIFLGGLTFDFDYQILMTIYGDGDFLKEKIEIDSVFIVVACMVMPVLVSIADSCIQLVISCASAPIYGVVMVAIILVISVYCCNNLLIGNYWMLLRSEVVVTNTVNMYFGVVAMSMIIFSGYFLGRIIFRKKDFY